MVVNSGMERRRKERFDLSRPLTHIKISFGTTGYWIEDSPEKLPYGTILTELLEFDAEAYHQSCLELEQAAYARAGGQAAQSFRRTVELFAELPLYNRLKRSEHQQLEPSLLFRDTELGMLLSSDPERLLHKYQDADEALYLIQEQYAWFLDTMYQGPDSEKKKGQKKESPAGRIARQSLSPLIGEASLGSDRAQMAPPVVSIQYEVIPTANSGAELVENMYLERLTDFAYLELCRGIQSGFIPKRCRNCGHWFLQQPGAEFHYCPRIAPGETEKTCRDVGSVLSFQSKIKHNPVWQVHQRAYKKYFARTRKNTLSAEAFELWARNAEQLRNQALTEYEASVDDTRRTELIETLREALNRI